MGSWVIWVGAGVMCAYMCDVCGWVVWVGVGVVCAYACVCVCMRIYIICYVVGFVLIWKFSVS